MIAAWLVLLLHAAPKADCAPLSPAGCPAACAKGSLDACRTLAVQAVTTVVPATGLAASFGTVKKACKSADPTSCTLLGVWTALGQGTRADDAAAAKWFAAACDAKDADACAFLARYDKTKTLEDRLKLSTAACEGGSAFGCATEGTMVQRGDGGATRDLAKGAALIHQACEKELAVGCMMDAIDYQKGQGVGADSSKAAEQAQKSCGAGLQMGCLTWADALIHGHPPDLVKAKPLLEHACDAKLGDGCHELSVYYAQGLAGVKPDAQKVLALLGKACELGDVDGDSCAHHALALLNGSGIKADPVKGAREAKRACDQGNNGGCDLWAHSLAVGQGVKKDVAAAKAVLKTKCGEGVDSACNNLRVLEK